MKKLYSFLAAMLISISAFASKDVVPSSVPANSTPSPVKKLSKRIIRLNRKGLNK